MEYNRSVRSIVLRVLVLDRSFFESFPGQIKLDYFVSIGPLPIHQLNGSIVVKSTMPFNGGLIIGGVQNPSLMRQITTKVR
jgi:hypothetical protein